VPYFVLGEFRACGIDLSEDLPLRDLLTGKTGQIPAVLDDRDFIAHEKPNTDTVFVSYLWL
jgi:hypothetical protein